ncbi:MAG: hypothetical protein CMB11_04705 [Euryarchaeota archaeon]|nr:hypothetical protein [Euryarchaeota archaeon]|tara:strand:+ start:61 stop:408 length:348 start_codon:yes stop_codon:yes gene_type:complete
MADMTVEDWGELASMVDGPKRNGPIVLQFGSQACVLCPEASQRLHKLMTTHHFEWHYMDATLSQLAEELEVTKLPAIAVIHSADRYTVYQQLRDDDVDKAIASECQPRFVLDADF